MRSFRLLFLMFMMAVLLVSCGQTIPARPATPTPTLSAKARVYLTTALDIMQQHSVKRKHINWTTLRQQTFTFTFGAQTPDETYPAINYALVALGDHHSSLIEPEDVKRLEAGRQESLTHGIQPRGMWRIQWGTNLATHPLQIWATTMMEKHHFIEELFGSQGQFTMFDIHHRHCRDM